MAKKMLDATKVYDELQSMGHDYTPAKQRRKGQLNAYLVVVYDAQGNESLVNADQVEWQVEHGGKYLTWKAWAEANGKAVKPRSQPKPKAGGQG